MVNLTTEFNENWQSEAKKNAAVFIRNEVGDWTGPKKPLAEKRWLWELLQNALDAGKDNNVTDLKFSVASKSDELVVTHNGGKFSLKEIIHLVSGGTSKYFGMESTIGKFGKGFLTTHVLSKQTMVEGWVSHADETRQFRIKLDRPVDEVAIEENINSCSEELESKHEDISLAPGETRLTYLSFDKSAVEQGLKIIQVVAPYLLLFNPSLVKISINVDGRSEEWSAAEEGSSVIGGLTFIGRKISTPSGEILGLKALGNKLEVGIQLRTMDGALVDTRGAPCFYYKLPLYASDRIETCFALNSPEFAIDTDRAFIHYKEESNLAILMEMRKLVGALASYLSSKNSPGLDLLAWLGLVGVSDEESNFFSKVFSPVAEELLTKPIAHCGRITSPETLHIPSSQYTEKSVPALLPNVKNLLDQCYTTVPTLFPEWEKIAEQWEMLGVRLKVHSVQSIITDLSAELAKIEVTSKTRFVESLIECIVAGKGATDSIPMDLGMKAILLNQYLELIIPQSANIDENVDEELKSIATDLGWDVKKQLIDKSLLVNPNLRDFVKDNLCGGAKAVFTTEVVLQNLWDSHVSSRWRQGPPSVSIDAVVHFGKWGLLTKGKSLSDFIPTGSLPMKCEDGSLHCTSDMQSYPFVWPMSRWDEGLKNYKSQISTRCVLSEDYFSGLSAGEIERLLKMLAETGTAYQGPIIKWPEKELEISQANALSLAGSAFTARTKVPGCIDIIGFQDATSGTRGPQDQQKAAQILDFVFNYIIPQDKSWRTPMILADGSSLYPSLWTAVLKTKAWVPQATKNTLEPLDADNIERLLGLRPDLRFTDEVIEFLSLHFAINLSKLLALRVRAMNPADERVLALEGMLSLPTQAGRDLALQVQTDLANLRTFRLNTKIGKIVEEVVYEAFEKSGLRVDWTGIGSDISVAEVDATGSFTLKRPANEAHPKILVEVKSARTDVVRLTMPQARNSLSTKNLFVLCVADLRAIALPLGLEDLDVVPKELREAIRDSLTFTIDLWQKIDKAVEEADDLEDHEAVLKSGQIQDGVELKFEQAQIRLGVHSKIWVAGLKLGQMVEHTRLTLGELKAGESKAESRE